MADYEIPDDLLYTKEDEWILREGDDVVIGAGAVVTKDIDKPGIYAGNPAIFIGLPRTK